MNILQMILNTLRGYPLKRFLTLFFVCFLGLAFISTSFISCGPGFDNPNSGDDDDDDDEEDDDDDEEDDRDDGDTCRNNITCEAVCEKIYEEYAEARKCFDEGDKKVGRIQRVHNLLMGNIGTDGNFHSGRDKDELLRDLEVISDSDDDDDEAVEPRDLEYYLEIGATKYITAIKNGLGGDNDSSNDDDKLDLLVTTLEWMINNKEIAKRLEDVNDGSEVLEELLLGINSNRRVAGCIRNAGHHDGNSGNDDTDLWGIDVGNEDLIVFYYENSTRSEGKIGLDKSSNAYLYDALSCLSMKNDDRNVFSYAAEEDNETIFNMAFNLLDKVCEDVGNVNDQPKACAKIMMCWTAWKIAGGSPGASSGDSDIWDMAEEHKSKLDPDDSDYDKCYADDRGFAKFF